MPRTEQEILNDFQKLGYKFVTLTIVHHLTKYELERTITIVIDFVDKNYRCVVENYDEDLKRFTNGDIGMQEHKLLHELFTIWGWF